jgi:hypothetical protein
MAIWIPFVGVFSPYFFHTMTIQESIYPFCCKAEMRHSLVVSDDRYPDTLTLSNGNPGEHLARCRDDWKCKRDDILIFRFTNQAVDNRM